jgi:hypothetical protein
MRTSYSWRIFNILNMALLFSRHLCHKASKAKRFELAAELITFIFVLVVNQYTNFAFLELELYIRCASIES